MGNLRVGAAAGALVLAAACSEPSAGPLEGRANAPRPAFAVGGPASCPTPATVVVTDEAGLLAALSAASPGDVIGLNGFFGLTAALNLTRTNLTLTCATPGSGLFVKPGAVMDFLVRAWASGVTVDRLVLDGSAAGRGPYVAVNDGTTGFADGARLTSNRVACGPDECAFLVGTKGAIVADNYFESAGSVTGVHLQGNGTPPSTRPIDGSRVERNTIVATAPSTSPGFGGIRPRDGRNVVVSNNVVIGPWANSVSPIELRQSVFEGNRLEGAAVYGVRFSAGAGSTGMSDNVLRNNRITAAGSAGVFAFRACGNVFVGNNLQGNADNIGLIFAVTTGANTLVGNQNVVVDVGSFDCNGDGVADPNIITGRGAVNLGGTISDAVVTANGLR
jgi:hypothetical protein